ncbi:stalk domain-containing protein [Paenibacillus psychroresistens]|nr:stalk domain-containing protein [Paenibacillus psychroresistens]
MFKRTIATVITSALILISGVVSPSVFAAKELPASVKGQIMIAVIVNGQKVLFPDTEPYLDANSRTLVPVRFVSESLGAEVKWDDKTRTVTLNYKGKKIVMPLNSKDVSIDGTNITLDTAAVMTDGRTMVPLRFASEAMDADVKWDGDSHYVKVSDKAFQAKVDSGEIKLDPWGRMLAPTPPAVISKNWNVLSDIPSYVYTISTPKGGSGISNKKLFEEDWKGLDKSIFSVTENQIRDYYLAALNVDYRTIDENTFVKAIVKEMTFQNDDSSITEAAMRSYVKFVKKNHIVIIGYADPEMYLTRYESAKVVVRTHFKFKVVSSDNVTEALLDSYDPSITSETFKVDLGKWYDGYADVLFHRTVTDGHDYSGIAYNENMFVTGAYKYSEL